MKPHPDLLPRGRIWVGLLAVSLAVGVIAAAVYFRPKPPVDSVDIPLGVEQAAIITYSGPKLTVAPYKWGAAVNVRIAGVTDRDGVRIYDVRYLVNRGGVFDLKDYLTAEDGSALEGLPSFRFHGDPKLSKELDARIRETEEARIDVGGNYYATLAGLAAFWIVWLLLLIFWRRPKKMERAVTTVQEPTLVEQLRAALAELESGTMDAAGKARLEMLLLRRWREELALGSLPMHAARGEMERSEKTGSLLRQIEHWIHHRASSVKREEIAAALQPWVREEAAATPESRP